MPVNSFDDYPMSWKPVINKELKPLYLALARQLEQDIISGSLLPGTKLPPQRELADFLDINVSTVSKAFKVCSLKGLLSSITGSGTFVCYDALSNVYLLPEGNPYRLIEMGATMPDRSANAPLLDLLKNMLGRQNADRWFSYSKPRDADWQKDAAVRLLSKCGFETERANILLSHGGQNALTAVLAGAFRYGDRIGVDSHTYSGIKTSASMLGLQLVPIRQIDGKMDLEALISACKNDDIKGVYVIPTHQNPTTYTMPPDIRKNLAEIAREHDILIIEDGTYHLMSSPAPAISSFAPERGIYIASLSKVVAPGLRMGYVSVPLRYKTSVSGALYNLNVLVPPIMAELSARVVVSGHLDSIIENHRENTIRRNKLVNKYLKDWNCRGEDTCIFRWLQLPENVTGAEFERRAMNAGVQVYAAERFAVGRTIPDCAVRIAVCAPETEKDLKNGLLIIQNVLKNI